MEQQRLQNRRLGYALKHVQHLLRNAMDTRLADVDLTTPQYAALSVLERDDGVSNAELARRCFVTPQTMHRIVARLDEAGLIERTPHPTHGRVKEVHLTADGHAHLNRAHDIVAQIEDQMTAELTPEEMDQTKTILATCAQNLKAL